MVHYDFQSFPPNVSIDGTVQIVSGKIGMGVHFGNTNTESGSHMDLERIGPAASCMQDLNGCPNGITVAFYIKIETVAKTATSSFAYTLAAKSIMFSCLNLNDPAFRKQCQFRYGIL